MDQQDLQGYEVIQVTQVPKDLALTALLAHQAYQDHQAGRVHLGMSSLPGQVIQAHQAALELWGQGASLALLETQGLLVYKDSLDAQAAKESQETMVTQETLVLKVHPAFHVTSMDLQAPQDCQETLDQEDSQATMVRRVIREIQVHLVMDIRDHKVSLVLLAYQDHLDQEGLLAPQEILGWMPVVDKKVKGGTLEGLEIAVCQVFLDLQGQ